MVLKKLHALSHLTLRSPPFADFCRTLRPKGVDLQYLQQVFLFQKQTEKINKTFKKSKMKNLILLAALFVSINVFAAEKNPTVNEKVLKTFNLLFKDAQDVRWSTATPYSVASFESDDVKTKAVFDKEGNMMKTFRYYKEDKLPANILYNVKKRFDHEVWGVTEVADNNGTEYHIALKSSERWYTVKADANGTVLLLKKFKRGDICKK